MFQKRLAAMAAALVCVCLLARPARADWPDHTVKVVVGQAAGNATDIIARVFADALSRKFGQSFIIDNKPGANGIIGTDHVAHAPADGYTILFTYAAAQVVNQWIYKQARYDGFKDFEPIAQIGEAGNVLVVPPSVSANDLQEFIAYVKSKPANTLAYGSWGIGSGGHLTMEAVMQKTGISMVHVPYKGTVAEVQDLLAGQIQVGFASTLSTVALVKAGKLKALAIGGAKQLANFPGVKTLSEQGVPFELTPWYGLFAPKGTPRAIVDAINAEANRLIAAPEMQQQWETLGFAYMPTKTPDQFAATVKRDVEEWGNVVRAIKLNME